MQSNISVVFGWLFSIFVTATAKKVKKKKMEYSLHNFRREFRPQLIKKNDKKITKTKQKQIRRKIELLTALQSMYPGLSRVYCFLRYW